MPQTRQTFKHPEAKAVSAQNRARIVLDLRRYAVCNRRRKTMWESSTATALTIYEGNVLVVDTVK